MALKFGKKKANAAPKPAGKPSSSRLRPLLLLLLLVVLASGGAYYYLGLPVEAPVVEETVRRQPIKPPPAQPAKQAVPKPPEAKPAPVAAKPKPAEPVAKAPAKPEAGVLEEVMPDKQVAAVQPKPAAKPVAAKPAPVPAPVAAKPVPKPAPKPAVAKHPVAKPTGQYTLQAGAFLFKANLQAADAKVRKLGFEPRHSAGKKQVEMTRFRVGSFPPAAAKAKLQELKKVAPDAFALRKGDQLVVYAGSYFDLDQGRRFADMLYEEGVKVDEETADIEVPLTYLSFGDFASLAEAKQMAAKAKALGLEAFVAKHQ